MVMEYIDSSMDLVKPKKLLLAESYLVFQLFIFKVNTFTRMYLITAYFVTAKYFSFVMVKNIVHQFSSVSYSYFINNLDCFAKYWDSVSFVQFELGHKQFDIIEESFNLKFNYQMISHISLNLFDFNLLTTE